MKAGEFEGMVGRHRLDKFGEFEVVYRNGEHLELGEVIQGKVELYLRRPVSVSNMTVSFYGEVRFDVGGKLNSFQFEHHSQELWRDPDKSRTEGALDMGFYAYEFFVGTALHLPSGFVAKKGSLKSLLYYCEAVITEISPQNGSLVEHIKRKPLMLKPPNIPLPVKFAHHTVAEKGLIYVRNCFDMSGCVAATLLVTKRIYRPGDNISFNVEVLNCFRRLKVYVSLAQKAKIALGNGSFDNIFHEIVRIKLGSLATTENYKNWRGQSVWIPDPRMAPVHLNQLCQSRMISLGYALVLSVRMVTGKGLRIEIPIVIRHKPSPKPFNNGTLFSGAATF